MPQGPMTVPMMGAARPRPQVDPAQGPPRGFAASKGSPTGLAQIQDERVGDSRSDPLALADATGRSYVLAAMRLS